MKGRLSGTKGPVFLVWPQYTRPILALPAAPGKMNLAYFSIRSYLEIEKLCFFSNDLATVVLVTTPTLYQTSRAASDAGGGFLPGTSANSGCWGWVVCSGSGEPLLLGTACVCRLH